MISNPSTILFLILSTTSTLISSKFVKESNQPLFSRRATSTYPPADVKGPTPQASWVATYNAAKAAGKIPGFAPSVLDALGNIHYPAGQDLTKNGLCSWTLAHCFGPNDISDSPAGVFAVAFDDGPQLPSPPLYSFLKAQNQKATHFMIGSRILDNPTIFQQAVANGDQIAVHTWSHPMMSNMTDMQVLGELGWTLQIIFDQSGLIPAFWRPPYGDVDNRVRAIAYEVFGMTTTIWNKDTNDWCFRPDGTYACSNPAPGTPAGLDAEYQSYVTGPKTPGIITLNHELSPAAVAGWIKNYPSFAANGWSTKAIGDIWNTNWYQNAANTFSTKTSNVAIGVGPLNALANSNSTSSSSSSSASSSLSTISTTLPTTVATLINTTSTLTTTASASHSSTATSNIPISTAKSSAERKFINSFVALTLALGSMIVLV